MFQTTVLGGASIVPESNEWYATSLNYAMAEEFYAIAEQAWKERDPATACAENLYAMAARDGMYRRPAQPAQGYVLLTGTVNAALPANLEFTIDGNDFVSVGQGPTSLGTQGRASIHVRAVIAGDLGQPEGTTATLTTAAPGVNHTGSLLGCEFCWGRDEEDTDTFRRRYIARLQYQPRADAAWLVDKFLDWPCVTRAARQEGTCCSCGCVGQPLGSCTDPVAGGTTGTGCSSCGCVDCGGKNNYYVFMDNSYTHGIIPDTVRAEIQTWMFGSPQGYGLGQVPIGVCGEIRAVTPAAIDINVDLGGCPDAGIFDGVRALVAEFFSTVEPSKPVAQSSLKSAIDRQYPDVDAEISWSLADHTLAYGGIYGPERPGISKVYFAGSGCVAEPDCDVMIVLGTLTVTPSALAGDTGGCL
jgi:hypothetical protein